MSKPCNENHYSATPITNWLSTHFGCDSRIIFIREVGDGRDLPFHNILQMANGYRLFVAIKSVEDDHRMKPVIIAQHRYGPAYIFECGNVKPNLTYFIGEEEEDRAFNSRHTNLVVCQGLEELNAKINRVAEMENTQLVAPEL